MKRPLLVLLFTLLAVSAQADHRSRGWKRHAGEVLYRLKPDATPAQIAALEQVFRLRRAIRPTHHRAATHVVVYLQGDGRDEETLAEEMIATGSVLFAEPDFQVPPSKVPNDPSYSSQWFHAQIRSPAAWDITTGNAGVSVAVCDTGVDAHHPDLRGNVLPGHNVIDGSSNAAPIAPHGTEVSGIIAAAGNNASGIVGAGWNLKIRPVRVTNSPDGAAACSDMATGIEWAADHGAKVINLSYETRRCPETIELAARHAHQQGALVVVASGNDGEDLTGTYVDSRSYLLVGASDASDHRAPFSNYGSPIDLMAPGVDMMTLAPGGYTRVSGTSFAAPLTAGVAGLIFSLRPGFTPTQVQNFLTKNAKDIGAPGNDRTYGAGRLDAGAALAAAKKFIGGKVPDGTTTPDTPDFPLSPEAGPTDNQAVALAAPELGAMRAYPNPWRADQPTPGITFDRLTSDTEIRLFTVSGQHVRSLQSSSSATWDLKNDSGEQVASGIYLFLATDRQGGKSHGKLVVIR